MATPTTLDSHPDLLHGRRCHIGRWRFCWCRCRFGDLTGHMGVGRGFCRRGGWSSNLTGHVGCGRGFGWCRRCFGDWNGCQRRYLFGHSGFCWCRCRFSDLAGHVGHSRRVCRHGGWSCHISDGRGVDWSFGRCRGWSCHISDGRGISRGFGWSRGSGGNRGRRKQRLLFRHGRFFRDRCSSRHVAGHVGNGSRERRHEQRDSYCKRCVGRRWRVDRYGDGLGRRGDKLGGSGCGWHGDCIFDGRRGRTGCRGGGGDDRGGCGRRRRVERDLGRGRSGWSCGSGCGSIGGNAGNLECCRSVDRNGGCGGGQPGYTRCRGGCAADCGQNNGGGGCGDKPGPRIQGGN